MQECVSQFIPVTGYSHFIHAKIFHEYFSYVWSHIYEAMQKVSFRFITQVPAPALYEFSMSSQINPVGVHLAVSCLGHDKKERSTEVVSVLENF